LRGVEWRRPALGYRISLRIHSSQYAMPGIINERTDGDELPVTCSLEEHRAIISLMRGRLQHFEQRPFSRGVKRADGSAG
jgi:hypothetical protein